MIEGDEAHADVGTLHAQRLDALQHGLLDKLEFNQIISSPKGILVVEILQLVIISGEALF